MTRYDRPDLPGVWETPTGKPVIVTWEALADRAALPHFVGGWQEYALVGDVLADASHALACVLRAELHAGNISADVHDRLSEALHPLEVPRGSATP